MLTKKQVLLTKIEAEEGVAETVSESTDAVLILDGGALTPEGGVVGSARLNATLSNEPDTIGQKSLSLTAPCEFRGGGITGDAVDAPDFDDLLMASAMKRTVVVFVACGVITGVFEKGETVTGGTSSATGKFVAAVGGGLLLEDIGGSFEDAETLTGGTSSASCVSSDAPVTGYQYMPTSVAADMKSMTAVRYHDGHKFVIAGARNSFSLNLPTGEKPTIEFTVSGRWANPVQEDNPTPTLLETSAPLVVNMGLKVGDHAPLGVNAISLDMANAVTKAQDLNAPDGLRAFNITGRKPAGGLDPEAENLSLYNPWTAWMNGDLAELSFLLGSVAGNRIYVSMPKVQRTSVGYSDREGTVTYDESFELKRDNAGDDELRMVFF